MLQLEKMPAMVFIDDDGTESIFDPCAEARTINALAAVLRARVPLGTRVGLVARSGPNLVTAWLASLVAGLKPLILQYPTKKQTLKYWSDSVTNTLETARIGAVIVSDEILERMPKNTRVFSMSEVVEAAQDIAVDDAPFTLTDYEIIQLSSGTTGFRKAVGFTGDALLRHAQDYQAKVGFDPSTDVIVSWLPLYHDMGYVACFVVPMILGIRTVTMDPMTWVATPQMLFDAIERHRGTICYMPNFGFEVMSRSETRDLTSMRMWVSCAEPVAPGTSRRFLDAHGLAHETFCPTYALAENVYAATCRFGLDVREIDGTEVVSCGQPIAGVELRLAEDGEVWMRSPTSLKAYLDMDPITDLDGFFPTGDVGRIIDGEVFITGRKQDIVIQAGRKFILSDIDIALNELLPSVKGRGVACQYFEERLGTQGVQVLIEDRAFFSRADGPTIAQALMEACSVEALEVAFVPPRFLTKTSSGKLNRKKCMEDFQLARKQAARDARPGDPVADLHAAFEHADWSAPVSKTLDSLSLTILRVILQEQNILFSDHLTLDGCKAALLAAAEIRVPAEAAPEAIHIVSLADRGLSGQLTASDMLYMSERLGRRVTFEHLCLPPSPIILSDLVFHDWFMPRVDGPDWGAVKRAMATLRSASLILTDDVAEMYFPPKQTYAVLSHNLERDPDADLVLVRWQRYPQYHDRLPCLVVRGSDLPLADRSATLDRLSDYLGIPIFRMATLPGFGPFTSNWEFKDFRERSGSAGGNPDTTGRQIVEGILNWLEGTGVALRPSAQLQSVPIVSNDLAHFCSHFANRDLINLVVDRFDRFCIAGQPASCPYLRTKIEAAGKAIVQVPSFAPEVVERLVEPFDIILTTGPQGLFDIRHPAVAIMASGPHWRVLNVNDPEIVGFRNAFDATVERSGEAWFNETGPVPMKAAETIVFRQVRQDVTRGANRKRLMRYRARVQQARRRGDKDAFMRAVSELRNFHESMKAEAIARTERRSVQ